MFFLQQIAWSTFCFLSLTACTHAMENDDQERGNLIRPRSASLKDNQLPSNIKNNLVISKYARNQNEIASSPSCLFFNAIFEVINNNSEQGYQKIKRFLLSRNINPAMRNRFCPYGNTTLHYAALSNNITLLKILLKHAANPNKLNYEGQTPWDFAYTIEAKQLLRNASKTKLERIRAYWYKGTKAHWKKNWTIDAGWLKHFLLAAQDPSQEGTYLVKAFLCEIFDPSFCDRGGNTALHYATASNNIGSMKVLLKAGADPFKENKQNKIPLHFAKDAMTQNLLLSWMYKINPALTQQIFFNLSIGFSI